MKKTEKTQIPIVLTASLFESRKSYKNLIQKSNTEQLVCRLPYFVLSASCMAELMQA